jgi:hypothetical protein
LGTGGFTSAQGVMDIGASRLSVGRGHAYDRDAKQSKGPEPNGEPTAWHGENFLLLSFCPHREALCFAYGYFYA